MRNPTPLNRLSLLAFDAGGAVLWAFAGRLIGDLLLDNGFSWSPDFGQTLALIVLCYIIDFPTISIGVLLLPVSSFPKEPSLILYSVNGAFWGVIIFLALRFFKNRRRRNVKE